MSRRPITTVLFDLDGTLLDSIQLIIDSYHHALRVNGVAARSDDHWLAGIGTPLRIQFRDWAHQPDLFDGLISAYRDHNLTHHDRMVRAYPGAVELVRELRALGRRIGLVTSKQRPGAERGLRFLGLADAMDVVVAAEDVTNPKPHPEPVLRALEQLDAAPADAIYVGDSVHDMESGRQAGVRTAAALWGPFDRAHLERTAPTHWLERPSDLLALVI